MLDTLTFTYLRDELILVEYLKRLAAPPRKLVIFSIINISLGSLCQEKGLANQRKWSWDKLLYNMQDYDAL